MDTVVCHINLPRARQPQTRFYVELHNAAQNKVGPCPAQAHMLQNAAINLQIVANSCMSGPRHTDTLSAVHSNTQYLLDTRDSRGQLG